MGRIVIACYRPKAGKDEELRALMRDHLKILKSQNLVTDRDSILMSARDGTVVEVFEWKSTEALQAAHENPAVNEMWARYAEVCEYVPNSALTEAEDLFSEFSPYEPGP